ncbi:MAG: hypothetical protein ACJ74Z_17260 [Bryobacteraceae bacterium]
MRSSRQPAFFIALLIGAVLLTFRLGAKAAGQQVHLQGPELLSMWELKDVANASPTAATEAKLKTLATDPLDQQHGPANLSDRAMATGPNLMRLDAPNLCPDFNGNLHFSLREMLGS